MQLKKCQKKKYGLDLIVLKMYNYIYLFRNNVTVHEIVMVLKMRFILIIISFSFLVKCNQDISRCFCCEIHTVNHLIYV